MFWRAGEWSFFFCEYIRVGFNSLVREYCLAVYVGFDPSPIMEDEILTEILSMLNFFVEYSYKIHIKPYRFKSLT